MNRRLNLKQLSRRGNSRRGKFFHKTTANVVETRTTTKVASENKTTQEDQFSDDIPLISLAPSTEQNETVNNSLYTGPDDGMLTKNSFIKRTHEISNCVSSKSKEQFALCSRAEISLCDGHCSLFWNLGSWLLLHPVALADYFKENFCFDLVFSKRVNTLTLFSK